jgi:hypothetical protein
VGPTCQRLKRRDGVPLWARGTSWAWAVSWPGPVGSPTALFYFFETTFFFFSFETDLIYFAIKLAQFEILQICQIWKKA